MFPFNFPANHTVDVDPNLWKACAGKNVNVPELSTTVYYFPEGHASDQFDYGSSTAAWPIFRCQVLNVRYLADRASDEVFAAVLLQQVANDFRGVGGSTVRECLRIDSYMKTLTQSDANNGGGFSVPRHCAESIFPGLNYQEDPPVQTLTITDVQGVDWVFRHIYRGTPKRHLLTTGWSKFVNHKKLIAGDQVIFMRDNFTGKLYVGIRRLEKSGGMRFGSGLLGLGDCDMDDEVDEGIWRSGNKTVSGRFVKEAAMHAAQGKPFEIIIDPRCGLPDVLINAEVVDRALSLRWVVGMPVKMVVETHDDSLRSVCRRGHISMILNSQVNGQYRSSPWKMLQVTWVEPEHLQNVERVSPWQVEYAEPAQPIHPITELREPQYYRPSGGRDIEQHPMIQHGDPQFELLKLSLFNSNTHLASMQGARQSSDVSAHIGGDSHQIHSEDTFQRSELSLFRSRITELYPGGHLSGNFSPESHSSLRSFGTEIGNLPTSHGCISSIQLFGKLIYVNSPAECQSSGTVCLETDCSSKGDIGTEGIFN